jgi:hypothetical protein
LAKQGLLHDRALVVEDHDDDGFRTAVDKVAEVMRGAVDVAQLRSRRLGRGRHGASGGHGRCHEPQ